MKKCYLNFINIDLEKYFDKVNHNRFLEIFSVYSNKAIIEFVCKFCKVGYVNIHSSVDKANCNTEGITQGSPHIFNFK